MSKLGKTSSVPDMDKVIQTVIVEKFNCTQIPSEYYTKA